MAERILRDAKIETPLGILTRPYKIDQFLMTTTVHSYYTYPWNSLIVIPRIAEVLKNYAYMRADVRVRFLFNCPITTYGMIAATPLFGQTGTTLADRNSTDFNLMSYPGTILSDCSQRESIEMVIPYISAFDHMPLHTDLLVYNGIYLGLDALRSTLPDDATPAVDVEVYANFENVILNGPQIYDDSAMGHMHLDPTRRFTTAAALATVATTMGFTGVGNLIGVASQAASMMGETSNIVREADNDTGVNNNPTPTRIIPWGNVVSNHYTDTQQYLGSMKYNSSPTQPLNGPNHSFNFYDLIQIPSYLGYSGAHYKQGTEYSITLVPEATHGYLRDVVRLFRRYRGSYKLMIRFVCSPLTVARFNVSFGWGTVESNVNLGDMYSFVVSIQGTHTECFQVPYLSPAHWVLSGRESEVDAYAPYVVVKCESTDTASSLGADIPTITVYMWLAAGDDFVLQSPQSPFYYAPPTPDAEGHSNLCQMFKVDPFTPVGGIPMKAVDPRDIEDLHVYLNRYSKAEPSIYTPQVYDIPTSYITSRSGTDAQFTGTLDWLSWYFAIYTSGGRRYKVPVDVNVDMVMQNSSTNYYVAATSQNIMFEPMDGVTRSYAGQQSIIEFEVPYICEYSMFPIPRPTQPPTSEFTYLNIHREPIPAQIADIVAHPPVAKEILVAAGHDYQLHVLQPPSTMGLRIKLTPSVPPEARNNPLRPVSSIAGRPLGRDRL